MNVTARLGLILYRELRIGLGFATRLFPPTDGGAVYLDKAEDGVVLRTANQAVARAQALAKQYAGGNSDASVDAFLNRRRENSGE